MLLRVLFILLFSVSICFPDAAMMGEESVHEVSGGETITYGYDAGTSNSTGTNGVLYIPYESTGVPLTFSGSGTCDTIKVYNDSTVGGYVRIWKGTISGTTFSFDSYTEVVDYGPTQNPDDLGYITLSAPTDFTAFAVTSSTVLAIYCYNNTNGIAVGRVTGVSNQIYAWHADDPPYSGDLTSLTESTSSRIILYGEGF